MNQVVVVLYSGIIQFWAERDLLLTKLLALISPYLTKFMKHNKSYTAFLRKIVIFSPIYLWEVTYVISSFNLMKNSLFVMFCAIRYHLHTLRNMKNTHEGVLLLIKLQALAYVILFWFFIVPKRTYLQWIRMFLIAIKVILAKEEAVKGVWCV